MRAKKKLIWAQVSDQRGEEAASMCHSAVIVMCTQRETEREQAREPALIPKDP